MLAVKETHTSGLQVRLTYFDEDCWFIAEDIRKFSRVSVFPGMKLLPLGAVRMENVTKLSGAVVRTTIISISGIRELFTKLGLTNDLDWFDRTYAHYRALMRREAGVDVVVPETVQEDDPEEEALCDGCDKTDLIAVVLEGMSDRLDRMEAMVTRMLSLLEGVVPKNETPPTDGEYTFLFELPGMGARKAHRIAREIGVIGERNYLILDSKNGAFALKPRLDSTGRTQVSLAANQRGVEMLRAACDGNGA